MRQWLAPQRAVCVRLCRLSAVAVIAFAGLALAGCTGTSSAGPSAGPTRLAAPVRLAVPISLLRVTSIAQRRCSQDPTGVPGPGPAGFDWCYHLASGLTLTRMQQIGVVNALPSRPGHHLNFSVVVCVARADRTAFATLMKSSVSHQIAIVISGSVLEAPVIQSPVPTTELAFTDGSAPDGFTRHQANRLLRRLTGNSASGSGCWVSPS